MASRRSKSTSVRSHGTVKRSYSRSGTNFKKEKSMEAKVDVRKLQILNDRINQTIDALNQVRISVHGLGHTGGMPTVNPLSFLGQGHGVQQAFGMQQPYGVGAQGSFPGVGNQFGGQQGFGGIGTGLGFQHTPFNPYMNPYTNPFTNPYTNPYTNPFATQGMVNPWGVGQHSQFTGTPFGGLGVGGVGGGLGGGLFHSSPDFIDRQIAEARASDPYRISQTFPFVTP